MMTARYNRREALKGLAASAVVVPWVVPGSALGYGDKPAASNRVTVGHIGVGGRGRALFRDVQNCKEAQSVATADAYKDRREACAQLCGGKAYADLREMLARTDIDAVVIATPDHWHVPAAILAARAGKDAYVEKPLGLSIEQNLACRKVFAEKERIFQYGTQQRSMAHCWLGCELVRSGRIGEVRAIEVIAPNGGKGGSTQEAPAPPNLDLDMWIGPAPMKPYTPDRCKTPGTYWIYDYSIGYLAGWGAHPLDIMVWGSDADLSGPVVVEGVGEIPKEGLYDTVYNWDMKIQLGKVKMTFKPGGDSTKFIGTQGWIQVRRGGLDAEPKSLLKEVADPEKARLIKSPHHATNFIAAVRSRKPAVSNLAEAVRSDNLSHLCDIAVRTGRTITWDPKKETIEGDAAAARLAHRDMRAPWTL